MNETATFGGGCFWCVEAVYQQLDGVQSVTSGYMGGKNKNPTYKEICTGQTGHAEVVQICFNPEKISFEELLLWFWRMHDPTSLNRQGNDCGTQYRSVIFTNTEEQRKTAEESREGLEKNNVFPAPIVTEISPASSFYPAEAYHQNYYRDNQAAPYCQMLINPKLQNLGLKK